jgi:DNA-binding transcriptional ArsR family regulator
LELTLTGQDRLLLVPSHFVWPHHSSRLQILQLPAGRPRSTREIAGLVGLTEAAISRHLKLLAEAGWVEPERHSYYVYYRLVRDARGKLDDALEDLLK